jgi:hypothetical protein
VPGNVVQFDFRAARETSELVDTWLRAEALASSVRADLAEAIFEAMDRRMMKAARAARPRKRR